jgi:hypothetical protein
MMPAATDQRLYARALDRLGYLRFFPEAHRPGRLHVEWFHFVVHAGDVDLLINFSLSATGRRAPTGHVMVLARQTDGGTSHWEGGAHRVPAEDVRLGTGRTRVELGGASLHLDDAFHVRVACRDAPLTVDLRLVPASFACHTHNLVGEGDGFHWVVAPRLFTSGTIDWNGRRIRVDGAPAYHDHNWGTVDDDHFVWEWTCSIADAQTDAWNVVLVRLLDRTRTRAVVQGLLVWEGAHRRKAFRGRDLSLVYEGFLRPTAATCFPRGLSLLAPGSATDVPQRVGIVATGGADHLTGELVTADVARIVVPRENDLGTTIIHEVGGRIRLTGRLGERDVAIDAPAFSEFVGRA